MMKRILILLVLVSTLLGGYLESSVVFGQTPSVTINLTPQKADLGLQEQVVYLEIRSDNSGKISGVSFHVKGIGVTEIIDVKDPQTLDGKLIQGTERIKLETNEGNFGFVFIAANSSLPSDIRIPILVKASKDGVGGVVIDQQKTQISGLGMLYLNSGNYSNSLNFSHTASSEYSFQPPLPLPLDSRSLSIELKIRLQGILSDLGFLKTMPVKVQIERMKGGSKILSPPQYAEFKIGIDGMYTGIVVFPNLDKAADYAILIKPGKHLQRKICDENPTKGINPEYSCQSPKISLEPGVNSELDFSKIVFYAGDLGVQDGFINAYDLSLVLNNVGKIDTTSIIKGDINGDGKVDKTDYDLIVTGVIQKKVADE